MFKKGDRVVFDYNKAIADGAWDTRDEQMGLFSATVTDPTLSYCKLSGYNRIKVIYDGMEEEYEPAVDYLRLETKLDKVLK